MSVRFLAAILFTSVFSNANASVIDFEGAGKRGDFSYLSQPIAGFHFNPTVVAVDVSATGWWGSGPAHSGQFAAIDNYGSTVKLVRDGGGLFTFHSAWVRSWYAHNFGDVTVSGFRSGIKVGELVSVKDNQWREVRADFGPIDTLAFYGRDVNGAYNSTLLDDINVAAVSEPSTMWSFVLGLISALSCASVVQRRRTPRSHGR